MLTQDEIIEMAREADLDWHTGWTLDEGQPNRFEAFAKLVAAKERADEREACAKICDKGVDTPHPTVEGIIMKDFGSSFILATAIRERGKA